MPDSGPKRLYRLPDRGMIAGVSAGIADYLDVDVTFMRAIWVLSAILTGGMIILLYIIMIFVFPTPEDITDA
jgi:phage shock protein C